MLANGCQCMKPGTHRVQEQIPEQELNPDEVGPLYRDSPFFLCTRCKALKEAGYDKSPILGIRDMQGNQTTGTVEVQMTQPSPVQSVVEKKENEKSIENGNNTNKQSTGTAKTATTTTTG